MKTIDTETSVIVNGRQACCNLRFETSMRGELTITVFHDIRPLAFLVGTSATSSVVPRGVYPRWARGGLISASSQQRSRRRSWSAVEKLGGERQGAVRSKKENRLMSVLASCVLHAIPKVEVGVRVWSFVVLWRKNTC